MIVLRNKYFGGKGIGKVVSESGLPESLRTLFAEKRPIIEKVPKNIPPKWKAWAGL
jgi:hypothetical protein